MDLDKLNAVNPERAGQAALNALGGVQTSPIEEQLAGLGIAFILACRVSGAKGGKVLEVAGNVIHAAEQKNGAVKGVKMYMEGEAR